MSATVVRPSLYAGIVDGRHALIADPAAPLPREAQAVYDSFRSFVLDPGFSCLGARSAVQRKRYRIGLYGEMGEASSTATLAHDLLRFAAEQEALGPEFTTFVACFRGPMGIGELEFERRLWGQLEALHRLDARHHGWDASVSSDPDSETFAFSVAGRAYFVVGLHGGSSRQTRRFPYPTLVFNAHEQFRSLREDGRFQRMQTVIRRREIALQGSLNPNLSDFGVHSEARQYSGRAVEEDWRCPFRPATGEEH